MYSSLTQKGIGREIKGKINENLYAFQNPSSLLMSPMKLIKKESFKRTIRIPHQEFDRRVNQAIIKYYEKFMTEIPGLIKEIDEVKAISDQKEKEYNEYMDKVKIYSILKVLNIFYLKVNKIHHYMNKIEKKQKRISNILRAKTGIIN